jgi:hypothetical protein
LNCRDFVLAGAPMTLRGTVAFRSPSMCKIVPSI